MPEIRTCFRVIGCGAWGLNFRNWDELQATLAGNPPDDDGAKGPKPQIIPANERRRAPLSVRLAVESSWQATQHSKLPASELSCVFVSGLGDTQLTDYMCKALASENKALSPTKFHNSVHNAAAGYWTISTRCMQAANSIAAFQESVSMTLLEAITQCKAEQRPLLLTFYDAPVADTLKGMLKNEYAFALSIVIAPANIEDDGALSCEVRAQSCSWPQISGPAELLECYKTNPAARILSLANFMRKNAGAELQLPLSEATSLLIERA